MLIRPVAESMLSTVETAAEFSGSDRRTPTSPAPRAAVRPPGGHGVVAGTGGTGWVSSPVP